MMTPSADPAPIEAERFGTMRHSMVASQLRTNAVNDARVVEAMARVPREAFVPADIRAIAYRDTLLPLPGGRRHNSPLATGRLLTEARIGADDHVLLIGAAGGYSAAVLAQIARSVVALESDDALFDLAKAALVGETRVELVKGPLEKGWAKGAPYDALVIDGAVEHIPDAIVRQLKPGATVVSGLIDNGVTRLASGRRSEGGFGLIAFADAECAPLPGFSSPKSFQF